MSQSGGVGLPLIFSNHPGDILVWPKQTKGDILGVERTTLRCAPEAEQREVHSSSGNAGLWPAVGGMLAILKEALSGISLQKVLVLYTERRKPS